MSAPRHARGVLLLVLLLGASPVRADVDPYAVARRYAKQHDVAIYSYHDSYIGNTRGLLAPIIRTAKGELLLVGSKSNNKEGKYRIGQSRPVVIKLDASGRVLWERAYKKAGFLDYEGASAIETDDGNTIVYILSYVHPARGSVTRLLKLDPQGKVLWHCQLRGQGGQQTPFPQTIQLTKRGTLVMEGHIYLSRGDTAHGWKGEVDRNGKVIVDSVGQPNPYGKHRVRR